MLLDDSVSTAPAQPMRPARQAALVVALALIVAATLVTSGVGAGEALALTAAVAAQMLSGAAWWLLLRRRVVLTSIELLGMGTALGILAAVLAAQVLRSTGLRPWGWALPFLVTSALVLVVPRVRRSLIDGLTRLEPLQIRERWGVVVALSAGLPTLAWYWIEHPLRFDGWVRYHRDLPFHEAISHSLHLYGPRDSVLVSGYGIRYHWLSHAWAGSLSDWADAEAFVVVTRLLPLVVLLATGSLAWSWARRLSSVGWVPVLAGAMVCGSGFVAIVSRSGGDHLTQLSPSQAFATPWLLAFALVLFEYLEGRLAAPVANLLVFALGFGLVGGKVSHAAVVAGGMVALTIATTRPHCPYRKAVWLSSLSSGSGVLLGYLFFVAGGDGNGLRVGSDFTVWAAVGLDVGSRAPVGLVAGAAAFAAAIVARWAGLVFLVADRERRWQPQTVFGLGVAATGVVLAIATTQTGGSQVYFAISASALVSVLAASGLGVAWVSEVSPIERPVSLARWIAVIGLGSASAGGALFVALPEVKAGLSWISPILVVLACLIASLIVCSRRGCGRRAMAVVSVSALSAAAIGALLVSSAYVLVRGPLEAGPGKPSSFTSDDLDAGRWLREHSDESDGFVTNRLCAEPTGNPLDCLAVWFIGTAASQRRAYVEGAEFGIGLGTVDQALLDRRTATSVRFTERPTIEDHRVLWNAGIRWVWLDALVMSASNWDGFGEVAFSNDRVTIVELTEPAAAAN